MTVDTGSGEKHPWHGAADQLEAGTTAENVDRFGGTPSPDRTQVAYLQGPQGTLAAPNVPYVAKANGEEPRRLLRSPTRPCDYTKRPAWGRDGKQMAVVCVFPDVSWSLWLVDARDGAGVKNLIPREYDAELGAPTWDASGHTVYTWTGPLPAGPRAHGGMVGRPVSVADDVDRPTPQNVLRGGDARYTEPDWAAPGLLMVHRAKDRDNKVVLVTGGRVATVAKGPYMNATWSPDGEQILATRGENQKLLELVVLGRSKDGWAPRDTGVVGNFGAPNWDTR
jgi:hypothetical protein